MTTLKQLQALVDAGDKATQGEWSVNKGRACIGTHMHTTQEITSQTENQGIAVTILPDEDDCPKGQKLIKDNAEFIVEAANSRPAIKAAIAEIEAKDKEIEWLRDVVEDAITASEWYQENSCDFNEADFEWRERAKQALGACETTERSEDNDE